MLTPELSPLVPKPVPSFPICLLETALLTSHNHITSSMDKFSFSWTYLQILTPIDHTIVLHTSNTGSVYLAQLGVGLHLTYTRSQQNHKLTYFCTHFLDLWRATRLCVGPILFTLSTTSRGSLITESAFDYPTSYVDDMQLSFHLIVPFLLSSC